MNAEIQLLFRKGRESDLAFVYSSWLQSFRDINILKVKTGGERADGFPETKEVSTGPALYERERYFKNQRDLVTAILKNSELTVVVNPEDPDQLYGYAVHRELTPGVRVLSYLYIKHPFRRMGLAKALYQNIGGAQVVTHGSPSTRKLIATQKLVYDPFIDLKLPRGEK